jgi:2-methylcitrate dehydratase PrpD
MQILRRDRQALVSLLRTPGEVEPLEAPAPAEAGWPAGLLPVVDWAWAGPKPAEAQRKARLLLLDALGCALAGLRRQPVGRLAGSLGGWFGAPRETPGTGALAAMLANAMAVDGAQDSLDHAGAAPGLVTAPLALAALQAGQVRLGEAVTAFALGYEVAARAAEAARAGAPIDWQSLGAAATAAQLQGASRAGIGRALQAAALHGTPAPGAEPARAILLGILAAAGSAEEPPAPPACTPAPFSAPGRWLLLEGAVRAFAGARPLHHVAAAALALHPTARHRLGSIRGIRIGIWPAAIAACGQRAPTRTAEAQASLSWAAAAVLVRGALNPACFDAAALADPAIRALEARVTLLAEPGGSAEVVLELDEGSLASRTDRSPGDAAQPMTEAEVATKFLGFARPALTDQQATQVMGSLLTGQAEAVLGGRLLGAR